MSEQAANEAAEKFSKYVSENPGMMKLTELVIANPDNKALKNLYFQAVQAYAQSQGHDQVVEKFSTYFKAGSR